MAFASDPKKENLDSENHQGDPQSNILSLSEDIVKELSLTDLSISDSNALRQVNHFFHSVITKKELIQRLSKTLLEYVLLGQYELADNLLKKITDPVDLRAILTYKGGATASSGQAVESTALGMALCAEDVDYIDNFGQKRIFGMSEMLMHYLRKTAGGEDEIARQIKAQFPSGWREEDEKNHQANLRALDAVANAIARSATDEECQQALNAFRNAIDPQGVIKTGKQWDPRLLLSALERGYNQYRNFDERQNDLYYVRVIGYIQRLAPDNFAQTLSQGIAVIFQRGETLRRSLKFYNENASYFPLKAGSGHGYTYWVASDNQGAGRAAGAVGPRMPRKYLALIQGKAVQWERYLSEAASSRYLSTPHSQQNGC